MMTDFTTDKSHSKILALIKAAEKVRGGNWINGAPSHIFVELLAELEKDGWKLIHCNHIPYSTSTNDLY